MKKSFQLLFVMSMALLMNCSSAQGQTEKVIETINKEGFWMPYTQWLENDDAMNGYVRMIGDNNVTSMLKTKESISRDKERAQEILAARKEILGSKGMKPGKKQDEILAKYFNDIEVAKRIFERAEQVDKRCDYLTKLIDEECAHRTPPVMPTGKLTKFSYRCGNGFAGTSSEVTLSKEDGKGMLKCESKTMRYSPDEIEEKEAKTIEVADSVFECVRCIVEDGMLYDVSENYFPDYMITDASNWSMEIICEGGSITTGGYAVGPDHSDTLGKVLKYLNAIYMEATEPKE